MYVAGQLPLRVVHRDGYRILLARHQFRHGGTGKGGRHHSAGIIFTRNVGNRLDGGGSGYCKGLAVHLSRLIAGRIGRVTAVGGVENGCPRSVTGDGDLLGGFKICSIGGDLRNCCLRQHLLQRGPVHREHHVTLGLVVEGHSTCVLITVPVGQHKCGFATNGIISFREGHLIKFQCNRVGAILFINLHASNPLGLRCLIVVCPDDHFREPELQGGIAIGICGHSGRALKMAVETAVPSAFLVRLAHLDIHLVSGIGFKFWSGRRSRPHRRCGQAQREGRSQGHSQATLEPRLFGCCHDLASFMDFALFPRRRAAAAALPAHRGS